MKHEMTLREAIEVLISHTERDLIGAGMGMRSQPSHEQKEKAFESDNQLILTGLFRRKH